MLINGTIMGGATHISKLEVQATDLSELITLYKNWYIIFALCYGWIITIYLCYAHFMHFGESSINWKANNTIHIIIMFILTLFFPTFLILHSKGYTK